MTNTKNTPQAQRSRNAQEPTREKEPTREPSRSGETQAAKDRPSPMEVLRQARGQLAELTGMAAESVSCFEQTEDGWALEIEVLELPRVPDTMSLMASYQVELDPRGQLTGYRRVRRYERGRADAHRPGGR
ncbi:gas vesicle protein GvpO [Streptomyces olivochromogenes]|uniref:gas vesicle protein GvpO n=1 Tax=Streptomyces olivochromogenes TaxID=1963 RepID=UPI001F2CBA03|nr:gas vesicle protein [Streptomyces olivochromogenes]MCF3134122.1 gas vesicle protein [Streptomyces olivochromogenes]